MQQFEDSLADPRRLELDREIALTDARLNDLLGMVDSGESGWRWKAVIAQWKAFRKARASGDVVEMTAAIEELDPLIMGALQDVTAWSEIHQLVQARRRLVESERKRIVEAQEIVTLEQARAVVHALIRAFQERVDDPAIHAAIAEDVRGILAAGGGGAP